MKRTSDTLEVAHVPGLEPEEQPTRRTIGVEASLDVGKGPQDPNARRAGNVPARITHEDTAAATTGALGTCCGLCANWRTDEWTKLRQRWAHPGNTVGAELLNRVRGELLGLGDARLDMRQIAALENGPELLDVEHALASLGICTALTEITGEAIITASESACPNDTGPRGEDLSKCFVPRRDRDTRRAFSKVYDEIMFKAQGRYDR